MALVKLEPQLRPLGHALAEKQFWWGRTKRKRRNAARAVANSSDLLALSERLSFEPTMETGNEKMPHGPEQTSRMDRKWERAHRVTVQAYGSRMQTRCNPI